VIANHVLEHVADESRALAEIRRVLRPGGWAMLAVPIAHKLDHTREDPSVVAPESRERLFGQSDHLRLYGRDYAQRLARAGFSVELWAGHVAGDGELAALAARPARDPADRDAPARVRGSASRGARRSRPRCAPRSAARARACGAGSSRCATCRSRSVTRAARARSRSIRSRAATCAARSARPAADTTRPRARGSSRSPLYSKILDQLPKLRTLLLFNWGEPLLHPQIEEIIAIAHRRGIGVHAHSNLSLKKDDAFFERLIDAGLTRSGCRSTARARRPTRATAWAATSGSRSRTSSAW
jgi:hypothetical protein